jgi:hypothetical protein
MHIRLSLNALPEDPQPVHIEDLGHVVMICSKRIRGFISCPLLAETCQSAFPHSEWSRMSPWNLNPVTHNDKLGPTEEEECIQCISVRWAIPRRWSGCTIVFVFFRALIGTSVRRLLTRAWLLLSRVCLLRQGRYGSSTSRQALLSEYRAASLPAWPLQCKTRHYITHLSIKSSFLLHGNAIRMSVCCQIWGSHGGHYECCRSQGLYAVWLLWEPTFRKNVLPPSSGWQESANWEQR